MTHLERFVRAVNRMQSDMAPCSFLSTPEMANIISGYTGKSIEELLYHDFNVDRRSAQAKYIGRPTRRFEDGSYENIWGVRLKTIQYPHGAYEEAVICPLETMTMVDEINHYDRWISPNDYDYTSIGQQLSLYPDYAFTIGYLSIGWFAWQLRGMEQHLEDLLLAPDIADATIGHIGEWGIEYFRRVFEENLNCIKQNLVCIQLADDVGTQNGLLISPKQYRRFYMPYYRTICDMAHRYGVKVEFHSCGSVIDIVPDLIETGIDMLNPIQTSVKGMDPVVLKKQFGKDIAFSGGIDVQQVLPLYTPDGVRDEVFRIIDVLGDGGGYVFEPSHAIQVGTPVENVLAMYRAYFEYYHKPCSF